MMKALLLFGFMFSLQSQALVPQSVYLNATTLGHLTGTYVLASATEAGKVVYHKTGTDYKIYWTPTSEGFWLVGTFIPGLHYTSELSIASDADIPPKTGWTGGRTLSYTYERSIFAHRPDLTPEPLDFTKELPYATWTNTLRWYALPASVSATNALDCSPVRSNGVYAGGAVATFDGTDDKLTFDTDLTGYTVTNSGTATLSIDTNDVNATAGTAWDIKIYDGATLWS